MYQSYFRGIQNCIFLDEKPKNFEEIFSATLL